jgi:hypothetical protein
MVGFKDKKGEIWCYGDFLLDREDGHPRKRRIYELTIGKSLTFYVSFYGFLGTIHNARQKEARKRGRKKEKRRLWKGEKRRLSKLSYATALRS